LEKLYGCLWDLNNRGEAADIFRHLCLGAFKALEDFHAESLVHRDIKPENFAVRENAVTGKFEVCLIDFGLVMPYTTLEPEDKKLDYLQYIGKFPFFFLNHLCERKILESIDTKKGKHCLTWFS
jgi:serine/threonine protein kinase